MVTKSEKTVEKKVETKTKTVAKPSLKISKKATSKISAVDTKKKTTEKPKKVTKIEAEKTKKVVKVEAVKPKKVVKVEKSEPKKVTKVDIVKTKKVAKVEVEKNKKPAKVEVEKTKKIAKKEPTKESPMLPISSVAPIAKRSIIRPDIVVKGNSRKRNLCLNLGKNKEPINTVESKTIEETVKAPVKKEPVKAEKEIPQDVPLVVVTPVVPGPSAKKDTSVNQNAAFFYEPSIFKKFDITVTESDDVVENDYNSPIDNDIETDENSDIESEITSAINNVITEIQDTSTDLIEDIDSYDIIDEGGFDIIGKIIDDTTPTEVNETISEEISQNNENESIIKEETLDVTNNIDSEIEQTEAITDEVTEESINADIFPLIGDIDDDLELCISGDIEEEIEKQYDEIIENSDVNIEENVNDKSVVEENESTSSLEINDSKDGIYKEINNSSEETFEDKNIDLNIYFNNYDELPEGINAFEENDYAEANETVLEAADTITPFYNIDNSPNNLKETADSITSGTINFAKETPSTSTNFSNIFKKFTFDETSFINPQLTTPLGTNYLQSDVVPTKDDDVNDVLNTLESNINTIESVAESTTTSINTISMPTTLENIDTSYISSDSASVDNEVSYYNVITPSKYDTTEDLTEDSSTQDLNEEQITTNTTIDDVIDIDETLDIENEIDNEPTDNNIEYIENIETSNTENTEPVFDINNDELIDLNDIVRTNNEVSDIESIFQEKISSSDCGIDQEMKDELLTEVLSFEASNPIVDISDTDEAISNVSTTTIVDDKPIDKSLDTIENVELENIEFNLDDDDPASDLFKMMDSLSDIISKLESEDEAPYSSIYDPNTLLISEENQKVYLPYSAEEVNEKLKNNDKYNTVDDVIENEYVVPLSNYKNPISSRFKEAYTLMRVKQGASVRGAIDLGLDLMFTSNLNPAIITACKDIIELNAYLDCLYNNETENFKYFNIVYKFSEND